MELNIPNFKIYWDEEDINAVNGVMKSGMNWATGPEVERFEKQLTERLGVKYAAAMNSGTSALHAVLAAYGFGAGDEIIVPSFTFIATANAALFVGAKPVFADIEAETLGLDPVDVEKKITPATRAILPIHYGGCPCYIEALRDVADRHGVLLIEDAAEAMGAEVNARKVGTFGDAAVLSFCQNKVMTTGEGGAVITDDPEVYERLKLVRSHGRMEKTDYFSSSERPEYVDIGYNFRLSNINAALGVAQLSKLDSLIEMRREKARLMTGKLGKVEGLSLLKTPENYHHVYQMFTVRIKNGLRDALMAHLGEKGIMARVYFYPVHRTQFYARTLDYDCELPITDEMSAQVLSLPLYPSMTEEEIDYITTEINGFFTDGQ